MYRVRQEELPFVGSSYEFVGAEQGDVGGWPIHSAVCAERVGLPFASLGILCYRITRRVKHPCGDCPFTLILEGSLISSGGVARAGSIFLCVADSSATSWQYPGARFLPG
jgi:hypothetical protein